MALLELGEIAGFIVGDAVDPATKEDADPLECKGTNDGVVIAIALLQASRSRSLKYVLGSTLGAAVFIGSATGLLYALSIGLRHPQGVCGRSRRDCQSFPCCQLGWRLPSIYGGASPRL